MAGPKRRGLIDFDIAGSILPGSIITSVQLKLFLAQAAGSGGMNSGFPTQVIDLHALTDSWGEGTTEAGVTNIGTNGSGDLANDGDATWSSRFYSATTPTPWTAAGGDYVSTVSSMMTITRTVNAGFTWPSTTQLVSDVQAWLDSPSSNFGWELINEDETTVATFRAFYTRETADTTLRPQLIVNFTPAAVPEPSTLVLASLGVVTLWGIRRSVR